MKRGLLVMIFVAAGSMAVGCSGGSVSTDDSSSTSNIARAKINNIDGGVVKDPDHDGDNDIVTLDYAGKPGMVYAAHIHSADCAGANLTNAVFGFGNALTGYIHIEASMSQPNFLSINLHHVINGAIQPAFECKSLRVH